MLDGKKGVAQKVVYGAFDIITGEDRKGTSGSFHSSYWRTSCPTLEVKARRVGGATYQVPIEVKT